jgi:hypothetical protein
MLTTLLYPAFTTVTTSKPAGAIERTVNLKVYKFVKGVGLSSPSVILTSYTPGSVSFEVGEITNLGYFPLTKIAASPKSTTIDDTESSLSGSKQDGNIN